MKIEMIAMTALAFSTAVAVAPLKAQEIDYGATTLTGAWGGERQRLHDDGIDLSADYVGEFATNTSGGDRNTSAYADQIHIGATFDFEKLWGWKGGSFVISINDRNGDQLDKKASLGTLLETQEIYGAGDVTRLTRFYYDQKLWNDLIDIKFGRMDISDDFFPFSCNFQNLNFCGSLPGYNTQGWFNYPVAQTGGVLRINPSKSWYVKLGAFDVNKNNLNNSEGLSFSPSGKSQGTLILAELGWSTHLNGNGDLPGTWAVGGWRNSGNYPNLLLDINGKPLTITGGTPRLQGSVSGSYAMGQQQVTTNEAGGGLSIFANIMQGDSDTDYTDNKVSIGLFYSAPFASRPEDRIGFALGRDHVSSLVADGAIQANAAGLGPLPVPGYEYLTELNYKAQVIPGLYVMPNIQYIRHPGGISSNPDATVLGMRLAITL
ncbi:carbohydrate porin [Rhodanobacter sp. BL-MT-08]